MAGNTGRINFAPTAEFIERCARLAHEANRVLCEAIGDFSQLAWDAAFPWQRESAIEGVKNVFSGLTPSELHAKWAEKKIADGWTYGPVKRIGMKQHPCLVPFEDLPHAQRMKDRVFHNTVSMIAAFMADATAVPEPLPAVDAGDEGKEDGKDKEAAPAN